MRRRLLELALGCALALLSTACPEPPKEEAHLVPDSPPRRLTEYPLLAPSGPHPVGKLATSVVDASRGGLFSKDPLDRRELSLYVWYPTEPERLAGPARYVSPLMAQEAGLPVELASLVRTNATATPPLSSSWESWPVVIFLPGLGVNVEFYASLLEELASHGYVVVGIDPTFIAGVTEFPDGRAIYQDEDLRVGAGLERTPLNHGRGLAAGVMGSALMETYAGVMADDASFVLDVLAEWNEDGGPAWTFAGRLELSWPGVLGHSMGGAAALRALGSDPRFRAGIDLDGGLHGESELLLGDPLMILGGTYLSEGSPALAHTFARVGGPGYWLALEGAGHFSFTDAGLLLEHFYGEDVARRGPFLGPIGPARATRISRDYILAFFEQYLRGKPSPLLEGPSSDHPEVRFHKR